jgi:hypothetical protein
MLCGGLLINHFLSFLTKIPIRANSEYQIHSCIIKVAEGSVGGDFKIIIFELKIEGTPDHSPLKWSINSMA